ncbi:MAG: UDP-N-acetylmuramate dehydrogenase [Planctomycetota bacterium]
MSWRDDFADILDADRDLAESSYYRIGGRARAFLEPRDAGETAALVAALARAGEPWRVLGGGANVLMDDADHDEPIVHPSRLRGRVEDGELVRVGAGESFPRLVADVAREGREGLETLAGIPGQVGGICAMNAGGRHGEFADRVVRVQVATTDGELRWLARDEVGFGYRHTDLPAGVVTAVELRLPFASDPEAVRGRAAEILRRKKETQPLRLPSSGCVFANPEGGSAGRLIDELGLKGRRVGDAEISPLHGNFIVNLGAARYAEVLALIDEIEAEAASRRGIALRREIRVWPAWRRPAEMS